MEAQTLSFEPVDAPRSLGPQMAPLIDIVFLLICFFMLATQLVQTQADPSVRLPTMSPSQADRETPAEIIVNLRQDGSLLVSGQMMNTDALGGYLAAQAARHAAIASEAPGISGGLSERLRVVIRADGRQHFDRLDKVLSSCREAGIGHVILRAERGDSR